MTLEPISDPLEAVDRELAENVAKWIQLRGSELPYDPTNPPLDMDGDGEPCEDAACMTAQITIPVAKCYSCGAVFPAGIVSRPIYCPECGTMNSRAQAIKRADVQVSEMGLCLSEYYKWLTGREPPEGWTQIDFEEYFRAVC
ncbi:MAG: hypothetical protein WCC94_03000 [Candidatus Bathyarchaeia archaeon]